MRLPKQTTRIAQPDPLEVVSLMRQNPRVLWRIMLQLCVENDQPLPDKSSRMRRIPGRIHQIRLVSKPNQRAPKALM